MQTGAETGLGNRSQTLGFCFFFWAGSRPGIVLRGYRTGGLGTCFSFSATAVQQKLAGSGAGLSKCEHWRSEMVPGREMPF